MLTTRLLRRLFTIFVAAAGVVTLVACNTMEGAGKDIERGGEELQEAAD